MQREKEYKKLFIYLYVGGKAAKMNRQIKKYKLIVSVSSKAYVIIK